VKEPNDSHKNSLKEEILQEILKSSENFMEILLDMVRQMYKRYLRNSETPKIKNERRHRNK
jgi:hypothetical protein